MWCIESGTGARSEGWCCVEGKHVARGVRGGFTYDGDFVADDLNFWAPEVPQGDDACET